MGSGAIRLGGVFGIAMPGNSLPPLVAQAEKIGVKYEPDQFRCVFWDIFGENGHPVRATGDDAEVVVAQAHHG